MAEFKLFQRRRPGPQGDDAPDTMPLGGSRAEAVQRLQIGLFGIGAMILLVGLAGIIGGQADLADQNAVPEAAPTTEPGAAVPQRDPLADAGVVPDIPAEPSPSATPAPAQRPGNPAPGSSRPPDAPPQ